MTQSPNTSAQPQPIQQALVNLVVRGMIRGTPDEATAALVNEGLAMTKGAVTMPTPQGRAAANELLRLAPDSEEEKEVDKLFDTFLPINRRLRDVCSEWQLRPDGAPNDHSDAAYDDAVRERLYQIDSDMEPVLQGFAAVEPRLAGYRPRLNAALDKFKEGEASWLASPLFDSYHTVWMHLHQELIMMLGITRAEDEAREERLVSGRTE